MKTTLWITVQILVLVNVYSVPVSRSKRQIGDEPAVTVINNTQVCVVNRSVYGVGDIIQFADPCEICRCHPPGFACIYRRCAKRDPALIHPDCKVVKVISQCCPQYQCPEKEEPPTTQAALDNRNDLATEAAVQNDDSVTLAARQEEVPVATTERQRDERQEDRVTERSDELFTGRSEELQAVTGKSEDLVATGRSEELVATGRSEDLAVITSEPPQALEGKSDDLLTKRSADLVLEPTEEPKVTEKAGRSNDEENTAEPDVEGKSDLNQTAEGRSEDLKEEGTSEKPVERRRREVDDGLTEKSADEEELTEKSADDALTPKSAGEDLTPKSVSEDLTPKSDDNDATTSSPL